MRYFFCAKKIGLSEASEVANWAIDLIKIGERMGRENNGKRKT